VQFKLCCDTRTTNATQRKSAQSALSRVMESSVHHQREGGEPVMCTRQPFRPQLFAMALLGFAVTLSACGSNDRTASMSDNRPVGTSGTAASTAKQPIDLTGCVQKADGSFVLTQINRPEPNAAPTDKKGDGTVVEREQLHAAQHAYRLSADKDDDLEKLVGMQVKVRGTVTEKSDLIASDEHRGNDLTVGTSGKQDKSHGSERNSRAKIDTGDLARVDVASIEKVSAGCGDKRQGRKQ